MQNYIIWKCENEKLKNIIRSQSNVESKDFAQYLRVLMEDKNE